MAGEVVFIDFARKEQVEDRAHMRTTGPQIIARTRSNPLKEGILLPELRKGITSLQALRVAYENSFSPAALSIYAAEADRTLEGATEAQHDLALRIAFGRTALGDESVVRLHPHQPSGSPDLPPAS